MIIKELLLITQRRLNSNLIIKAYTNRGITLEKVGHLKGASRTGKKQSILGIPSQLNGSEISADI